MMCYQLGESVFGTVHYSPDCVINVVEYSFIKDRAFACWPDALDDIIRVQIIKDGEVLLFTRKSNIHEKCGRLSHNCPVEEGPVYHT